MLCVGCAMVAHAQEAMGPLPLRNYQPLRQIFLHLPVAPARVALPGELRLGVTSAESNVIATDRGAVTALLKFEQNRTSLRAAWGVAPGWQVGAELPLLSRFGGFLDPIIDTTEDLFSAVNPERKLFPNNSFGGFVVRRGRQVLFHGPRQVLELGDIQIDVQRELWCGSRQECLAVRGGLELPVGRESAVWGSGTLDTALGLALDYPLWFPRLRMYGNVGGGFPFGRVTQARLALDPFLQQALAFEWRVWPGWSLFLQQELYTSPYRELHSSVSEGTIVELAAGVAKRVGAVHVWIAGIENVSGVAQAVDFSLLAGVELWLDASSGASSRP